MEVKARVWGSAGPVWGKAIYWCLRAAFTNCHKRGGLKQKLIFSQFWRLEV